MNDYYVLKKKSNILIVNRKKVWIFTFEYAGIAKVGGLGEVPANQAKNLSDQFDITVFIPSHGKIERLQKITKLEKLSFNCIEQVDLSPLEIFEPANTCNISYYKCRINNVNIILLSGDNPFTSKYLNDKIVYNPDTFIGKLFFFSIAMRYYIKYKIANQKFDLPDIIHMHDYHVVIPFIGVKQELNKNGLDVRSIITIHLLTWPRYNINVYYACGIDNTPIKVLLKDGLKLMTIRELFTLCEDPRREGEDYYDPTVEKIGAVLSDLVTTVSNSYLYSDIIPNLGQDLIEFKSDFVWDGCDWDYNEIYQMIIYNFGNEMRKILTLSSDYAINREDMKKYLLTYKISHLSQSPLIYSNKVLKVINEISNGNPFIKNGNIRSFDESGPLVISTGRVSRQKGFETIFEAIPIVIKVIPNAKFLLLILPTDYSLNEIRKYAHIVKQYPNNLRIIFGLTADIFYLAHIAADAYCALSRWEPFGIIALESMAVRLPIIASRVGGLQETIIDIRIDPEKGTGILVDKDDPSQFANALISLFKLAEIAESVKIASTISENETLRIINQIPDDILKAEVLLDGNYYNKIKDNCYRRVKENFRWNIVSKKLINLYIKVMELYQIS